VRDLKFQSGVHRPFELVERARLNGDGTAGSVHNPQR
jgi:hypothetical protein